MKKLFTLVVASFVAIGVSARQPQVILNSPTEFDVKIDGQFFSGNSTVIPSLSQGVHTIEVYSVKGGILGLGKKRELVSSKQFSLRNNDVRIDVDQYGQARITEIATRDDRRVRDDGTYDGTVKNHGTLQGKGKKYGHYKDGSNRPAPAQGKGKGMNKASKKNKNNRVNDLDDRD
jgi:hypothetical protein